MASGIDAATAALRSTIMALEAAAPHMLARGWDEGASAQARCYGMEKDTGPNPYRLNTEGEK